MLLYTALCSAVHDQVRCWYSASKVEPSEGNGISGVSAREAIDCSSSIVWSVWPFVVRGRDGSTNSSYPGGRVKADGGVWTGSYLLYQFHCLDNDSYAGNSSFEPMLLFPPRPTTPNNPLRNRPSSRSRLNASSPRLCSRIVFPFRRRRHRYHPNTAKAIAPAKIKK